MCEVLYSSDVIIVYLDLNIWVDVPMGEEEGGGREEMTVVYPSVCSLYIPFVLAYPQYYLDNQDSHIVLRRVCT